MEAIKAIPTVYKGVQFRSKLEAQWAKFFDSVGIEWAYEQEGYQFEDGTRYLPDFYLPEAKQFFEVKGVMTDKDMHKIEKMLEQGIPIAVGFANGRFRSPSPVLKEDGGYGCFLSKESRSMLLCCELHKTMFFCGEGRYFNCDRGCDDCPNIIFPGKRIYEHGKIDDWNSITQIDVVKKKKAKEEQHGRWEYWTLGGFMGEVVCSNCDKEAYVGSNVYAFQKPEYCPHCHARMDLDAED